MARVGKAEPIYKVIGFGAVIASLLAATCQSAPTPPPAPDGKLTVMVGDLGSEVFDFAFATGGTAEPNYARLMHAGLVASDQNANLMPGIATHWRTTDGKTWTFTIRQGVKFQDGSDLTPQDVLWSVQHYLGPEAPNYMKPAGAVRLAREITNLQLSKSDELTLTFKTPQPAFIYEFSDLTRWYAIMPNRAEIRNEQVEQAYQDKPIGAGPMRLVDRIPGYMLRFQRFDDFYYHPGNGLPEDRRVKFRSLELFNVPEEATRAAALRAGQADLAPVGLSQRGQVEASGGRMVFSPQGLAIEPRMYGCWRPEFPCSDKRVRQALDYSINKSQIQALYGPDAFEIKGWYRVAPSTVGYTSELDPWPFDPNKARQLLADAGYPGGTGFGKLILNTCPAATMPFQVEAAQLVADGWWRELGLDVEVRVRECIAIRADERAAALHGQMSWNNNEVLIDPADAVLSKYGHPANPEKYVDDPGIFRLTQDAFAIFNPDERAKAATALFLRLREESYNMGIGHTNIPWGVGPRVVTWQPYPLAAHFSAPHTITLR